MNEPIHHRVTPTDRVIFDPAALTDDQRDGFTCVVCERDLATGGPSVPVGTVPDGLQFLGGQVFACASHLTDDQPDECTGCGRDDGPMYLDPRPRHPRDPQAQYCQDCAADLFDIGDEEPDHA